MGMLSSILATKKPTKYEVACRVAQLIECVVQDKEFEWFAAGAIVLSPEFNVTFCSNHPTKGPDSLAIVVPKIHLKVLLSNYFSDSTDYVPSSVFVDRLSFAVISEFDNQSKEFQCLENVFKQCGDVHFPSGCYIVLAVSAKYLDASREKNEAEMNKLLGRREFHYVLEVHPSAGTAKQRAEQISDLFPNGRVTHNAKF